MNDIAEKKSAKMRFWPQFLLRGTLPLLPIQPHCVAVLTKIGSKTLEKLVYRKRTWHK